MSQGNQSKRGRKFDQVIEGARDVFMREGFESASVDEIARQAGVSKATLYSYFAHKEELFLEVARAECQRQAETARDLGRTDQSARDTLTEIGQRIAGFFYSEFGQNVFRLCLAESDRFPDLARTFYRSGAEATRNRTAAYLQKAVEGGELEIEDCAFAADQFYELCKAGLWHRLMFHIIDEASPAEIAHVVDAAVEMFLARYGAKNAKGTQG